MAKTVQYWGTVNYQELPLTGRLVTWTPKQKQEVPDAIATLLLAAGVGFLLDNDNNGELAVYATDSSGNVTGLVGPSGGVIDLPRSHGTTLALLGDSFSARCTTINSACRDLDWGYYAWAQALMGAPFKLIYNGGVSGARTDQFFTNGSLSAVLAARPDWVILQGGINDITFGTLPAAIVVNLQNICAQLIAQGINVIFLSVAPNSQSAGNSTKVQQVNQAMREWCVNTAKGVIYVDTYQAMVNPAVTTGAFNTGMSDDSLHPSMKGARAMGQAIANSIQSLFPNRNFLPSSAGEDYSVDSTSKQLLTNPMLSGTSVTPTGTGASGTVPTGFLGGTGGAGATSAVFTGAVARTDGIGSDCQIVVSGAASGSSVNIRQTSLLGRAAIGDTIYVVGQVKITGASDLRSVNIGATATIDGTTYQCNVLESNLTSTTYDQSDVTLTVRSNDLVLTGTTITSISFIASAVFGTSGAGAATIKFGRLGLYKK